MAIERYIFTNTTDANANATELVTWMQENAAEYFDSIVRNSNIITCYVDSQKIAKLQLGTSSADSITIQSGTTNSGTGAQLCTQAYKTSHGILIRKTNEFIFITKANDGNTAVICMWSSYGTDMANLGNSDHVQRVGMYYGQTSGYVYGADLTTLTPIVFPGGTYTEHLFYTWFSNYANSFSILTIDGVKYVYTGAFALEE